MFGNFEECLPIAKYPYTSLYVSHLPPNYKIKELRDDQGFVIGKASYLGAVLFFEAFVVVEGGRSRTRIETGTGESCEADLEAAMSGIQNT